MIKMRKKKPENSSFFNFFKFFLKKMQICTDFVQVALVRWSQQKRNTVEELTAVVLKKRNRKKILHKKP